MKYPIVVTWGLQEMARRGNWYTPTGNYWTVVDNGLLGGELLYDHKTKKVYGLAVKEIKDAGDKFIEQCEGAILIEKASRLITPNDAKEIIKAKGEQ